MNRERKQSLLLTGLMLILVLTFVNDLYSIYDDIRSFKKSADEDLAKQALTYLNQAQQTPDSDVVLQLQKLQDAGKIGFYMVKADREPASISVDGVDTEALQIVPDEHFRFWKDLGTGREHALYFTRQIQNRLVTVGMFVDNNYFARVAAVNAHSFWRGLLLRIFGVGCILIYLFRSVAQIFRTLRWRGVAALSGNSADLKAASQFRETSAIMQAIVDTSQKLSGADQELASLKQQILPSFLSELREPKPLPREFDAYLVYMDINGSTKAFSNPELKVVQEYWFNRFFLLANESINRYGGYFHEVIGDAILFYVKVPEGTDEADCRRQAQLRTVACLRDISSLAGLIDSELRKSHNTTFTIKGSMDFGRLRVTQGFRGIRLLGTPPRNVLVTTNRMADFVKDKSKNQFVVPVAIAQQSRELIAETTPLQDNIPGLNDQYTYCIMQSFEPLDCSQAPAVLLHRNDQDLLKILRQLRGNLNSKERLSWIQCLREVLLLIENSDVTNEYLATLNFLREQADMQSVTASFIMLLPRLVPTSAITKQIEETLLDLMSSPDARVQANAIEVWGLVSSENGPLDRRFKHLTHNRSMANAIAAILLRDLSKKHLQMTSKMLKSEDEFTRSSGCYVVGKVIQHYAKTEPIILSSNPSLQTMITHAVALREDPNEMVRRQAERVNALCIEYRLSQGESDVAS